MSDTRAQRILREMSLLQGKPVTESKDVPSKHQEKIALKTLTYSDAGANIMGGMNKKEAIEFLRKQGYSDKKLTSLLKKSGHSDEEIKKLLQGK